jgi:hypothetical protein
MVPVRVVWGFNQQAPHNVHAPRRSQTDSSYVRKIETCLPADASTGIRYTNNRRLRAVRFEGVYFLKAKGFTAIVHQADLDVGAANINPQEEWAFGFIEGKDGLIGCHESTLSKPCGAVRTQHTPKV